MQYAFFKRPILTDSHNFFMCIKMSLYASFAGKFSIWGGGDPGMSPVLIPDIHHSRQFCMLVSLYRVRLTWLSMYESQAKHQTEMSAKERTI